MFGGFWGHRTSGVGGLGFRREGFGVKGLRLGF